MTEKQAGNLAGVRIIELADQQAEYCGLLLAGLGAEVVKVEPPGGAPTRAIGPFRGDSTDSLYFWHYNRGKKSVLLDLDTEEGAAELRRLVATADAVLDSTPRGRLDAAGLSLDRLRADVPGLVTGRISPFGDTGPWADWKGTDLVHLALGGPMMNCGYDPEPDGRYDLPPIAGQMWHSYHVAGEQLAMMLVGALLHRRRTGEGQHLSCAVHEAVAKSTELDLMSWVMRAAPLHRQTCRHAAEVVSPVPTIARTKDGRWIIASNLAASAETLIAFLDRYGLGDSLREEYQRRAAERTGAPAGRPIPGSGGTTEFVVRCHEALQRLFGKFSYATAPWREAQEAGLWVAPLRRPEENMSDRHWLTRRTFAPVEHPELGRSFTYVTSKWVSSAGGWTVGRRAPLPGEDAALLDTGLLDTGLLDTGPLDTGPLDAPSPGARRSPTRTDPPTRPGRPGPARPAPFALQGVRVFDFSWFLASAGGTRFLAALGAEVIKVEWREHPDTRMGAMAPVGGRAARRRARGPLPGVTDSDMGGQFNNKNTGKLGISLNVRDPRGLAIARELVARSDVVAEGFSPGVLEKWGLGYAELRTIRPDIIYAQQSGMGAEGTYGRFRSVGPIAAAFAGTAEMAGLAEPATPAGWGYSYLDWLGAYSFGLAIVSALHHRETTGEGQWIDASQVEAGLFAGGTAYLDWSVNGRRWERVGNRSHNRSAAPHGVYRCAGTDRWLAIACTSEDEWAALCQVADRPGWRADPRFATLADRLRHQDALDAELSGWTQARDPFAAMALLQNAGVPAGVCQSAEDRCERDPQLAHLGWLTEVTGSKIGTWPVAEVPVRMSATPPTVAGPINRGAPCYGEDNDYVFGELLGRSSAEIAELAREGVI
ncbi:MAG TPA: CoA transferase [Pseudonocardia sp.]|jgi:crotonobetainyl-CoA:carnitine CoA-transferase CaiB-like acyl-CoA transferase